MIPLPKEAMIDPIPSWTIIAAKLGAVLMALYGTWLILSTLWKNDKRVIKSNLNSRILCPTCKNDTCKVRDGQCYNCRNKPLWDAE